MTFYHDTLYVSSILLFQSHCLKLKNVKKALRLPLNAFNLNFIAPVPYTLVLLSPLTDDEQHRPVQEFGSVYPLHILMYALQ